MHTTIVVIGTVLVISLLLGFFCSLVRPPYKSRGFGASGSRYDAVGSDFGGHSHDGGGDSGSGDGGGH
jgi:hypothetical protein